MFNATISDEIDPTVGEKRRKNSLFVWKVKEIDFILLFRIIFRG